MCVRVFFFSELFVSDQGNVQPFIIMFPILFGAEMAHSTFIALSEIDYKHVMKEI